MDWRARAEQAEALVERLREYAAHRIGCPSDLQGVVDLRSEFRQRPCDCGLDALLADQTGARLAEEQRYTCASCKKNRHVEGIVLSRVNAKGITPVWLCQYCLPDGAEEQRARLAEERRALEALYQAVKVWHDAGCHTSCDGECGFTRTLAAVERARGGAAK